MDKMERQYVQFESSLAKSETDNEVGKLLHHPDVRERKLALKLASVQPHHLQTALQDEHSDVKHLALAHPKLDSNALTSALEDPDLILDALKHPGISSKHLDTAYGTAKELNDEDCLKAILGHPEAQAPLLRQMWQDGVEMPELVQHMECPTDVLGEAAMGDNEDVATQALGHPSIPVEVVDQILRGKRQSLRLAAARAASLPEKTVRTMLIRGQLPTSGEDKAVRAALVGNPGLPQRLTSISTEDHDPGIRMLASIKMRGVEEPMAKAEDLLKVEADDPRLHMKDFPKYRDPNYLLSPHFYHNDDSYFDDYERGDLAHEAINRPDVTPEQLKMGLEHRVSRVRKAAHMHPALRGQMLKQALEGHDADWALQNPNVTREQLDPFIRNEVQASDGAYIGAEAAAAHPNADPETVFDSPHSGVVRAYAYAHPSEDTVNRISTDPRYHRILGDTEELSPYIKSHHIQNVIDSDDGSTNSTIAQTALAEHPSVTSEQINHFLKHRDGDVRIAAVKNPNTTPEQLRSVLYDPNQGSFAKHHAKNALSMHNPDSEHDEQVHVTHGLSKMRKVRDFMESTGQNELHPNKVPGDYSAVRGKNGNISLNKINELIENSPKHRYNVSHDEWNGPQRHTKEDSNVFQLNLTNDHIKQMKEAGVYPTFRKLQAQSHSSGHPVTPHTIGWTRYTGDHKSGFHVDEVQSDLGQAFSKQLTGQAHNHATNEAEEQGLTGPAKDAYITKRKADLVAQGAKELPDEHWHKIHQIVFNGKPANEVVAEGFRQHLRDKGYHNTPIYMHSVETKGPESLPDYGSKPVPGHFNETYNKMPQKLGMEPGKYGEIPTQTNKKMKDKPVWKDTVRKTEEDNG